MIGFGGTCKLGLQKNVKSIVEVAFCKMEAALLDFQSAKCITDEIKTKQENWRKKNKISVSKSNYTTSIDVLLCGYVRNRILLVPEDVERIETNIDDGVVR